MDIKDYKKIRSQQDLEDYFNELEAAINAIIMNDGVSGDSGLYCTLRIVENALYWAKVRSDNFDVELNSFKDE